MTDEFSLFITENCKYLNKVSQIMVKLNIYAKMTSYKGQILFIIDSRFSK